MEIIMTAKMIDKMLPTQKAELIGQMIREGKRSKVEETCAISSRNVARYNQINYLIPSIQKLVDEYILPLLSAVALSYLDPKEQEMIYGVLVSLNVQLTPAAAECIKRRKGGLTPGEVEEIVLGCKRNYTPQPGICISLPAELCNKYFLGMSREEMMDKVERALAEWQAAYSTSERIMTYNRLLSCQHE